MRWSDGVVTGSEIVRREAPAQPANTNVLVLSDELNV